MSRHPKLSSRYRVSPLGQSHDDAPSGSNNVSFDVGMATSMQRDSVFDSFAANSGDELGSIRESSAATATAAEKPARRLTQSTMQQLGNVLRPLRQQTHCCPSPVLERARIASDPLQTSSGGGGGGGGGASSSNTRAPQRVNAAGDRADTTGPAGRHSSAVLSKRAVFGTGVRGDAGGKSSRKDRLLSFNQRSMSNAADLGRRQSEPWMFTAVLKRLRNITRDVDIGGVETEDAEQEGPEDNMATEKSTKKSREELHAMFHRAIRLVRIMAKACLAIREDAMAKTVVSSLQLQHEKQRREANDQETRIGRLKGSAHSNQEFSMDDLLEMDSKVPEWMKSVLAKPYADRTDADMAQLHGYLRYFDDYAFKFTPEMQLLLRRTGHYVTYENLRVILRKGHPGDAVYIILSGKVDINIHLYDPHTKSLTVHTECSLQRGQSFGNEALIRRNTRNASVLARKTVELLMVYREDFLSYNPDIFKTEFKEKLSHTCSAPLLRGWPAGDLESLCIHSTMKDYRSGEVVSRNTLKDDYIYFVVKGNMQVLYRMDVHRTAENVRAERTRRTQHIDLLPDSLLSDTDTYLDKRPGVAASQQAWFEMEPLWNKAARSLPKGKQAFIHVAQLEELEFCDLSTLVNPETQPMMLLANKCGVRVLRIPKVTLFSFAPLAFWKQLEGGAGISICPDDSVLFSCFLKDYSRQVYQKLVLHEVLSRNGGEGISHLPAMAKGTTGPAAWPGAKFYSRDDLGEESGLHSHRSKSPLSYMGVRKEVRRAWSPAQQMLDLSQQPPSQFLQDLRHNATQLASGSESQIPRSNQTARRSMTAGTSRSAAARQTKKMLQTPGEHAKRVDVDSRRHDARRSKSKAGTLPHSLRNQDAKYVFSF